MTKNNNPTGKGGFKDNPQNKGKGGAPRKGESWREILSQIGELDGQQALERAGRIFAALKKYPKGVTLKELSAISYYIRMINDPNGSLLTAIADRTEGKVKEAVDLNNKGELVIKIIRASAENEDGN